MTSGRKSMGIVLMVVAAALLMAADAYGFVNPPPFLNNPRFVPGGTGRHVDFDLSTETGEATTLLGPAWNTNGPDGDWTCDNVYWSGAVTWLPSAPSGNWQGHTGLFGIDNSQGGALVTGSLTFHVNNFPDPNWHKLVWDEIVYFQSNGGVLNHGLYPGPGSWLESQAILNVTPLDQDPGFRDNLSGEIRPNPDWEEIKFDFIVPAGGEVYLDSFEIATLCDVPEPSSIVLVIVAAVSTLAYGWRRRRVR